MAFFTRLVRLALAATASGALAEAALVEQVFNFSSYVSIENSIMRPNGHILFSTLSSGDLYTIDPSAEVPQAEVVATMPGATALTGFAQIGEDKYAVAGGVRGSYQYANETIYTIDFSAAPAAVGIAATLPDAVMLNGAAALPGSSDNSLILVGDARVACVWRVDVATGAYDQALAPDAALAAPANASVPIGVNGLRVRAGHLYLTNTGTGTLARVPIDDATGDPAGALEVVATVPAASSWDDFAVLADDGEVLACRSPGSVVRVSAAGDITTEAGADAAEPAVLGCSSVIVTDGAEGERSAYVTTKGDSASGLGGQILLLTGI